jgi:hypothetical protein
MTGEIEVPSPRHSLGGELVVEHLGREAIAAPRPVGLIQQADTGETTNQHTLPFAKKVIP